MSPNFTSSLLQAESKDSIENKKMIESVENERKMRKLKWYEFETKIIWPNVIMFSIFEALVVYWIFAFPYWEKLNSFIFGN